MNSLKNIKLTRHAQQRLKERNFNNDLLKNSNKWYNKDDLIDDCALYRHCCYICRKSKDMECITNGEIEIIYNKNTNIGITVLEVKDKFKPINKFLK